jgi:outer membrane protein
VTPIVFRAAALAAACFAAIPSSVLRAQDDATPIALDEAILRAQRALPAAVQARGALRNASSQERNALGAFLPSLDLSMSSGRTQGVQFFQGQLVPLRGDPWSYSNGVSSRLELFDGGRRLQELRRARAATDAADAGSLATRYDIALQVKQQYYAALAARESEAAARAQLEQAEQQLAASAARVNAGAATKSDSLRSVIQVGNAELALLTAQNDLRVANIALSRLVGSEAVVTPIVADTADVPVETELLADTLLERLVLQGPAVQQAEANLASARAARRAARTQYMPTLTVSYNYGTNAASQSFTGGNVFLLGGNNPTRQTMFFNLSLPIFNGFTRENNQVTASVALENAEAAARDAKLLARQQVVQQLRALETALARVRVQQSSIEAAEEDLRVQQQRYQLGASTLLDLLTSQAQLNTARQQLIQARLDARVAQAQLEALLGRDL